MSESNRKKRPPATPEQPARRQFLGSVVTGALAGSAGVAAGQPGPDASGRLFDRLYGCLAGLYIGSAMGVPVEGWSMERVAKEHGILKTFLPHKQWWNFPYPAGSTEDGVERAKYMCLAIIEKQDRITADDLVKMWVKITDDEKKLKAMKNITTAFDLELMAVARTGALPAAMLGTTIRYSHLSATIRCFAPITMINACDPDGAVQDLYDVARVYQPLTSDGFWWGTAYNAALAYAFRPDATVSSVIDTAVTYAPRQIKRELQRALDIAKKHADPMDMRKDFNEFYSGRGVPYPISYANETAVKALAIFSATKGNFKESMILSVNFGRDTDCLAAGVGALAGAFSGASSIPPDWIRTVDDATRQNPNTCSQHTIREDAEGIHRALLNRVKKAKEWMALLG